MDWRNENNNSKTSNNRAGRNPRFKGENSNSTNRLGTLQELNRQTDHEGWYPNYGFEDGNNPKDRNEFDYPREDYKRSMDRTEEEINEMLMSHPDIDCQNISVSINETGEVTLAGICEDRNTKRMIEDLTEKVSGVTDVRNEIKVNH